MGLFTRTAPAIVESQPEPEPEPLETRDEAEVSAASLVRMLQNSAFLVSVTEARAMKVPAFNRGMKMITGTSARVPLTQFAGRVEVTGSQLLAQPEVDTIPWVTFQRLFRDVALHATGYWQIIDVDETNGYPTRVKRLPAADVTPHRTKPDWITYKTQHFPLSIPSLAALERRDDLLHSLGRVIKFEQYEQGILEQAKDTLQIAILLEATAARFARRPLPQTALVNSGPSLTPTQVEELLDEFDTKSEDVDSTPFLQGPVTLEKYGWSARELQLVDARNQAAIQIARHMNLDPYHVGASLEGTSLTYGNTVDKRSDLIDFNLSDYLIPVQQRLSMRDVTPPGLVSQFDTTDFTRANLESRVAMVNTLVGLVDAAGDPVITAAEARELLTYAPIVKGTFA